MRNALRWFLYQFFQTLTRLKVSGIENIPTAGGCLITINHLGIVDGPLIFSLLQRDDVTGLVALKHEKNPVIRFIVENANGIWIDRDQIDMQAVKAARQHLKNGGVLGIAPEGTRSRAHALLPAKPGVAFLADKSDAVIVPTAIMGSENALHKIFSLQRPQIQVQFGKPFKLAPLSRQQRGPDLIRNTEEIMCQLAALLDPPYRGAYAHHNRLDELLHEKSLPK